MSLSLSQNHKLFFTFSRTWILRLQTILHNEHIIVSISFKDQSNFPLTKESKKENSIAKWVDMWIIITWQGWLSNSEMTTSVNRRSINKKISDVWKTDQLDPYRNLILKIRKERIPNLRQEAYLPQQNYTGYSCRSSSTLLALTLYTKKINWII